MAYLLFIGDKLLSLMEQLACRISRISCGKYSRNHGNSVNAASSKLLHIRTVNAAYRNNRDINSLAYIAQCLM